MLGWWLRAALAWRLAWESGRLLLNSNLKPCPCFISKRRIELCYLNKFLKIMLEVFLTDAFHTKSTVHLGCITYIFVVCSVYCIEPKIKLRWTRHNLRRFTYYMHVCAWRNFIKSMDAYCTTLYLVGIKWNLH